MEDSEIREAVKEAVESVRQFLPVRRRKNVSYARVIRAGYGEIKKLRDDGYSFNVICEALALKGIFDGEAMPKTFASSFLREAKRRARRDGLAEAGRPGKEGGAAGRTGNAPQSKEDGRAMPEPPDSDGQKRRQEERLKKLTGQVVDTGTGTIRKLPGGSFEF